MVVTTRPILDQQIDGCFGGDTQIHGEQQIKRQSSRNHWTEIVQPLDGGNGPNAGCNSNFELALSIWTCILEFNCK